MFLLFLIFVPFVMARLDLAPLQAEPVVTFCIGDGCPFASFVETVRETNFSCNGTTGSLYPDEKDCHSYYKCENGNATKITCPPGYGFYRLGKIFGYCTLEVYVKSCKTIDCRFNGPVPDPVDCTQFYVCLHGYPHKFQCPNGTLFNTIVGQCVAIPNGLDNPCPKEVISTTTPVVPTVTQEISNTTGFPQEATTGQPVEVTTLQPMEVTTQNATNVTTPSPSIQSNEI